MHLTESLSTIWTKHNKIFLFLITILVYINTVGNRYALDDAIVITGNSFVKEGFSGIGKILTSDSFTGFFGQKKELVAGGRYRPLSLVSFAIEYALFGEVPWISHLVNILFMAILVVLLFRTSLAILQSRMPLARAQLLAFITVLIFAVHPIHTEVVANIKGRDEILALLFSLATLQAAFRYIETNKQLWWVFLSLFLGLMAKENAITFLLVIPTALYFFASPTKKQWLLLSLILIASSGLFLGIRHQVLGGFHAEAGNELMNNPFLGMTIAERAGTILYTWVIYLKLMIFPHPLTFDYYPYHIPKTDFFTPLPIIAVLLVLVLTILAWKGRKTKSIFTWCFIGFWATFSLVSNVLFSVGTFMNERFLFMPSIFIILALVLLVSKWEHKINSNFLTGLFMVVFIGFAIKTIARNRVWQDDFTLFSTDVNVSVNSAKSNCSAGGKYWEEGKKNLNLKIRQEYYQLSNYYLHKAVEIHPVYVDAWLLLGNLYFDNNKNIDSAAYCYMKVLNLQPENPNALQNIDIVLQQSDDYKLQEKYYLALNSKNPKAYNPNYRLGVLYGRYLNNIEQSIAFLEKAVWADSTKTEALKDLGTAYGFGNYPEKAYLILQKAVLLAPNDQQIFINLGIAARQLGKTEEANGYFQKAQALQNNKSQ